MSALPASRAAGWQLRTALVAALVFAGVEALLASAALESGSHWARARLFASALGFWAWPALLASGVVAALAAPSVGARPLGALVRKLQGSHSRATVLVPLASALFIAPMFAALSALMAFRNLELASAIGTLLALVWAIGAWLSARAITLALGQNQSRWVALLASAALVLALLWIGSASLPGIVQLDPRLAAAPLAALLAYAAPHARRAFPSWLPSLRALSALLLLSWLGFVSAPQGTAALLLRHGAWTRYGVMAGRALGDLDRDGYSGWLDGGDCAPLNREVHPGADELPGDGIDNNCIGGDGGRDYTPRKPSWGAEAHGAIPELNLLLVTIETLRPDHVSFSGGARDTTPELRALTHESLVFERMYAAAPFTRLSLASLLSSYAPSEIDWLVQAPAKRMRRIGPKTPWLPELLARRGYATSAVLAGFSAFTDAESAGFERGFQHYDVSTALEHRGGTMRGFPAAEQIDKALAHLASVKRPFFSWLHLFEPHYLYEQPPDAPLYGPGDRDRYDAEIWHVDRQLGRLFRGLRAQGVWDKTLVFVTGDHGEAFGEHGERWHGASLFEAQVRTPALLRVPGLVGRRVGQAVTFTDIAPTLLRIIGDRAGFDAMRGRSLTPLLHRKRLPEAPSSFVIETFSVADGRAYHAAVIDFPLKLVYSEDERSFRLFDLEHDPREREPLDLSDPRTQPLLHELIGYLERQRPRALARR
jgi:arylsulfatase A-like enzyme